MTDVLIRIRKFENRNTDTQGRRPYEDGGRDCGNASTSLGMLRIADHETEEAGEKLFLEPSKGGLPF